MDINIDTLRPITIDYGDYRKISDAIWYIEKVREIIDPNWQTGEGADLCQAISLLEGLLEKAKPKLEEENLTTEEIDLDNIPF